jgi:hypothetical protein
LKKALYIILLITPSLLSAQPKQQASRKIIPVTWVDNLPGDYSFTNKWSYDESIEQNGAGQFSSMYGDVDEQLKKMCDSTGRIYDSLIHDYYKLLDTAHYFHTLECEGWCYEFAGADYIDVTCMDNKVCAASRINAGTHSILRLDIENGVCTPTIKLISIFSEMTPAGIKDIFYYHSTGGYIKIDKPLWQRGIMKAEFDFTFYHPENPKKKMYWKGKIYAKIDRAAGS